MTARRIGCAPRRAAVAVLAALGALAVVGGCASGASDTAGGPGAATSPRHARSAELPLIGTPAVTVPSAPAVTVIPRPASTTAAPSSSAGPAPAPASSPPASSPLPSAPASSPLPSAPASSPSMSPLMSHPAPAGTSSPGRTATARTTSPAPAPFRSSISRIDAALAARMHTSYHPGCPVPLSELRYLRVSYLGFDGAAHTGELVVSARVADDVVTALKSLYSQRFPIHRMQLVDDFGGSDDASMAADNTSAFNCRPVTGGDGWSEHSYGEAIDINPVENPYLSGELVLPPAGRAFVNRPEEPGVIHAGGVAVRAFAAIGWTWGGTWESPVDLQHFSLSGR